MLNKKEIAFTSMKKFESSCVEKLMRNYYYLQLHFESDIPMFQKIQAVAQKRFEKILSKNLINNKVC